jgi:large subunit ribosomal protein L28e
MASAFHSPELQWQLLRTGHSFLVKRGSFTFSAEPLNLTNQHSFKFSGLVNPRAVGVTLNADRTRVVLQTRAGRKSTAARPSKQTTTQTLQKHFRAGSSRGARTIKTNTAKSFLRPDLTNFAIHRYHALRKATTGQGKKVAARKSRKTKA